MKLNQKMQKNFGSSVDPETLSLTIKGTLLALVPMAIVLGKTFGLNIMETDASQFIESATSLIAPVMIIWGLIRKQMVS